MKRSKWVLKSFFLSVILLSVIMIQIQSSSAGNDEDAHTHLLRELEKHMLVHGDDLREAIELAKQASQVNARVAACTKALVELDAALVAASVRSIQDCPNNFPKNAPLGTRVSTAVRGKNGSTRVGAIFERVPFGEFKTAWQQISADGTTRGLIWIERIDVFTNENRDGKKSQAEEECEKRGGRLPTIDEFMSLRAGFDLDTNGLLSKQGRGEFHQLFPDMNYYLFWSSSPVLKYPADVAWIFDGGDGYLDHGLRHGRFQVWCVGG